MPKKEINGCESCGYSFLRGICVICDIIITDRCIDCHNEITHDIIKNQNVHICGNRAARLNSIDNDPDAYKRSD